MASDIKSKHKILIVIFLVSLSLRLFMAFYYLNFDKHSLTLGTKPFLFGYHSLSEIIGNRDMYNSTAKDIAFYGRFDKPDDRPALYSIFLAIFYILFGYNVYSFLIPQISLDAVNSILIFLLAQHLFDNKRVSLMASIFHAFNPHFILISIQLYSETLYFFLLLSIFLLFKKLLSKPKLKNSIIIGIFIGLAVLCRSVFFAFIPFIFAWLIIVFFRYKKKLLIITFIMFLTFSLIFSLTVKINPKIFHRFSLPSVIRDNLEDIMSDKNYDIEYYSIYKDEQELVYNWIKDNPEQYFKLCKKRLKIFLFEPCVEGVSFRHKVVSSLIFYMMFPLGYLGIIVEVIKKQKLALLILLYILSTTVLHILTSVDGELRYRLPIELFIIIFAAYGLTVLLDLFCPKRVICQSD